MTIRGILKGGTDFAEEGLKPSDLQDTFDAFFMKAYGDNAGGSIATSTTETDLATITVTQNDFQTSANFLIATGILFRNDGSAGAGQKTGTFRLKVNGSTVRTVMLNAEDNADEGEGTSINHFAVGLDSTAGNIIIKITGENSGSGGGVVSTAIALTVLGLNNNS